ncbi:hypothetical protein GCM10017687_81930 [Streptomyces echinatus]|uniref:SLAC1 family transporter n=1 Tax=Streptomyces echinatus TaxID=67293 RepID=UPI0031ED9CE7
MTDMVDTTEHTSAGPHGNGPARPANGIASDDNGRHAARAARIGLLSVSLGTAGLGGAWQAAATTFAPALRVSDALFAVSGLIWLVLLAQYLRHGGSRWRNVRHDLRHPGQGFALGYVPIVGMLIAGHFSRFELTGARWAYAVSLTVAALIAARLLAHWLTGALSSATLHPGYLLPVSSAPFVASAHGLHPRTARRRRRGLRGGAAVLARLRHRHPRQPRRQRPPARARPPGTHRPDPSPPATGGIAWTAAHQGVFDAVGYGFAGTLLFTVLLVAFLLPELNQPSFHPGLWVFSFPIAASTNFAIRWVHASALPGGPALTGILLAGATIALVLLAAATLHHRARRALPG